MVQISDEENIDEIDEFMTIHQKFCYQIFQLVVALATYLSNF